MPRLVLLSGEGLVGRSYELKVEKTTVGRVEDNAFQIPDGSVSSHHCEILLQGNDVVVRDLGSTNGSFINGERITEAVLKPGHTLRLGMIELKLETGEAAPGPGAAPSTVPKKKLDHTIVIPQGVKIDELEGPRATGFAGKTGFEKKGSKAGRIFLFVVIAIGVVLGVLLLALATRAL
jgi:pSer/pThr/pTyr-binding forkhead associated (FHA) protein